MIKKKKCPHCGRWIVSNYQQKVLNYLFKHGGSKVVAIAKKFKTTPQAMNNTLTILLSIRLIYRRELMQSSGGKEFIYFPVRFTFGKDILKIDR